MPSINKVGACTPKHFPCSSLLPSATSSSALVNVPVTLRNHPRQKFTIQPTRRAWSGARQLPQLHRHRALWSPRGVVSRKGRRLESVLSSTCRSNSTMAAADSDPDVSARPPQPMLARHRQPEQNTDKPTEEARTARKSGWFPLGVKEGWNQWVRA